MLEISRKFKVLSESRNFSTNALKSFQPVSTMVKFGNDISMPIRSITNLIALLIIIFKRFSIVAFYSINKDVMIDWTYYAINLQNQ